jgi:hypothetical protein
MGKHLDAPMGMEKPDKDTVRATSMLLSANFLILDF